MTYAPIDMLRVRIETCLEKERNGTVVLLPKHEMVMVRHETISLDQYPITNAVFFEQKETMTVVFVSEEDGKSMSTPIVNVIELIVNIFGHEPPP